MDAVRSLVAQVSSAKDERVPHLLLRLKETLHTSRLDSKQREGAFRLMWQSDLIHVMVGVTRKDSRLVGGWNTAAQLADLLATVCSGLKPQETRQKQKRPREAAGGDDGVKDFYKKLLPTAVDSLLILANSLIEHTTTSTAAKSHSSSVLQLFESILISLSRLCSSHRQCAFKAIQSPYILRMIASSKPHYCLALVTTLNQLVKTDWLLPTAGHPQSTLDVLAHRLTSSDNEELQVECLKLLALFIGSDSDALATLCSKYTALTSVVLKSKRCGLGEKVDLLVQRLEVQAPQGEVDRGVETESPTTDVKRKHSPTYKQATSLQSRENVPNTDPGKSTNDVAQVHHSATVIQACWRGYTDRKLLRRMKEITQPHCKDMGKEQEEFDKRSEKIAAVTTKLQSLSEMRTFHERQMLLLEQLPADKVTSFLHNQQSNAAKKIQSWWREIYDQERLKRRSELSGAVVIIQRAVRRFLKRREKLEKLQQLSAAGYPPVEGQERENLQKEIARYREEHAPLECSEARMRQTHDEVQQLLCEFYPRIQNEASEAEKKLLFLSKLEQDCTLLLEAPRLSEVSDEVVERFLSGSHTVATMARQAHHEELRASQLPWWKLPPSTTEGELLQLLN